MNEMQSFGLLTYMPFGDLQSEIKFERGISITPVQQNSFGKIEEIDRGRVSEEDFKIINSYNNAVKKEYDTPTTYAHAENDILCFVATLRIVKPILAYPNYFLHYIPHTMEWRFNKHNIDSAFSIEEHENNDLREFPVNRLPEVIPLWENMPDIQTNKGRVWIALWLNEFAYQERQTEFRILYFVMALESLFGISNSELRFRLSLTTARFISNDFGERDEIFTNIKKAYDIRSGIVHGLRKELELSDLRFAEINLREYLRRALLKIMQDRSLIQIFESTDEDYNKFIKNLVLDSK